MNRRVSLAQLFITRSSKSDLTGAHLGFRELGEGEEPADGTDDGADDDEAEPQAGDSRAGGSDLLLGALVLNVQRRGTRAQDDLLRARSRAERQRLGVDH